MEGYGSCSLQPVVHSPSNALRSLVSVTSSTQSTSAMLKRPVMAFVIEAHDLERYGRQFAITQSYGIPQTSRSDAQLDNARCRLLARLPRVELAAAAGVDRDEVCHSSSAGLR